MTAEGDPAGVSLGRTGYISGLGTEDRWPMRVQDVVKELQPFWSSNDPVPDVAAFQPIERAIGRALPADYKYFMMWSDGGEALAPLPQLRLYSIEELIPRRSDGQPPDVLEIGTTDDGAIAFDLAARRNSTSYPVVSYPLGDRVRTEFEQLAPEFAAFLSQQIQA